MCTVFTGDLTMAPQMDALIRTPTAPSVKNCGVMEAKKKQGMAASFLKFGQGAGQDRAVLFVASFLCTG